MTGDVIGAADRAVGDAIERATAAHHRRRLRRLGHEAALDPPDDGRLWATGAPEPRAGNALDVLIDGADTMAAIAEAVQGARRHVHVAGWCVTPELALLRHEPPLLLRDLLAEAAERVDVRVLLWAGAPVPLFKPTRAAVRRTRDALVQGTRIRVGLDARERPAHCHHEKLVIVDDEVAFVGGVDLTDFGGDRWDTPRHPARGRLGWHDVAARLRGPAVADAAAHVAMRWHEVTGERVEPGPAPAPAGDVELQLVRTVPERVYGAVPRGDFRIVESYRRALRSARELVYLESQFLWSPEVTAILADKLRRPPSDAFRVVVLLPVRANNGQDDTNGQLALLTEADAAGGGGRMLAATISALGRRTVDRIYVHAKVGIVDDHWLTLGSANLNAHSFFNDTEVNVVACDARLARETRLRLWAEHLEVDRAQVDRSAVVVVDELWRPIAEEQLERERRGAPRTHRLMALAGGSRRYERLLGPLDSIVVDG